MPDPGELRRMWDRVHRTQPASEQPEQEVVAFVEHLSRRVSPGARLLEAGCGRGRNALYLSRLHFEVYACDLSLVALEIARARAQPAETPVRFQAADLAHLPYADHSFEAALCTHVLPYHSKADMASGICELRRVLRPGGWLHFDLLDCGDADHGCGPEIEPDTFLDPDGIPVHFSLRPEIDELANGLTVERVRRFELKSMGRRRLGWIIWAAKGKPE